MCRNNFLFHSLILSLYFTERIIANLTSGAADESESFVATRKMTPEAEPAVAVAITVRFFCDARREMKLFSYIYSFFLGNGRSNSPASFNRPHGYSQKKATKGKTNTRFGLEFGMEEKMLPPTEQLTLLVRLTIELLQCYCYSVTNEIDFGGR